MFSIIQKKDFYNYINPRDICVHAVTTKKCEFKTRYGVLIGYSIENNDTDLTEYYIDNKIDLNEVLE